MGDLVQKGAGAHAPAPDRARCRVALGIAYDGAGYHGFAVQPNVRTVGGELKHALAQIAGHDVDLVCAGRTDAGVHALAQVVHVDLEAELLARRYGASGTPFEDLPALARAIDRQLGREAACWRARGVPAGFDARHSATARRYRYELDLDPIPDPRDARRAWRLEGPLDLAAMRLAADPLLGEHDFAAFCRRPPDRPDGPLLRKVTDAHWRVDGWRWSFDIEAKAFCHQMVRSIVGALVAVGEGRLRPSDVVALLRSGSRRGAPTLAPPAGLCLITVRYPDDLGGTWGATPPPEPWERAVPAAGAR
ncbi:MAG: tRNA pseudouridine(38-40) synthase TruA [Actinomycetota bacterium]|nr:tRNA pseudouridine(38-40) synthase TruA [Actinomycetota bacterium]